MTGPRLGGSGAGNDPIGWIARQLESLQTQITELRAARTLNAATIGSGGLTVQGGKITIKDTDGNTLLTMDADGFTVAEDGTVTISGTLDVTGDAVIEGGSLKVKHGTGGTLDLVLVLDADGDDGQVQFQPVNNPTSPASIYGYDAGDTPDGQKAGIEMSTSDADADGWEDAVASLDPGSGIVLRHGAPIADNSYVSVNISNENTPGINAQASITSKNSDGSGGFWTFEGGSMPLFTAAGLVAWVYDGTTTEWQARSGATPSSYIPVRASSFPTSSSRAVKQDIADLGFDPVDAVKAAQAQQWRYKPEHAIDSVLHVGPMAEDLPAALVTTPDDGPVSVDLLSLIGTLWEVNRALIARIEALEAQ